VQLYILESDILIHAGDLTAAGALLDRANDEFGDSADLLYARSLLAEKRGDIKGAERDLRRIISIDPDNGAALNALGYVLTNHSKRYLEAQGLIRRALVLSPNDPTVLDSMGWVKFRMGDTQAALGYLEQAYERYPDPEIAAHLGEVLWTLGRRERAIAIWREGLNKDAAHGVLRETVRRLGADEQVGATP
jgi:tetratricopeptide (TPR) repeat protein